MMMWMDEPTGKENKMAEKSGYLMMVKRRKKDVNRSQMYLWMKIKEPTTSINLRVGRRKVCRRSARKIVN